MLHTNKNGDWIEPKDVEIVNGGFKDNKGQEATGKLKK